MRNPDGYFILLEKLGEMRGYLSVRADKFYLLFYLFYSAEFVISTFLKKPSSLFFVLWKLGIVS